MKLYFILSCVLCFIMMFSSALPLFLIKESEKNQVIPAMANITDSPAVYDIAQTEDSDTIAVFRSSDKSVEKVKLFDYVCGCLAAEMPLTYHDEALKAQAVACFSYALWITKNADNPKDELYDISDDSATHQGFMNNKEMEDLWGDKYEENYNKIENIVSSVENQYLSYNNEPIMAAYHSLSPGRTVSAKKAWGNDITYLQSTTAPGDKLSPDFSSTQTITEAKLKETARAGKSYNFDLKADPISQINSTNSGLIKNLKLYSVTLDSSQLRSLLGLKSPFFTLEVTKDNSFVFTVYGSGHGVGMSQYSADYMARQGSDYKEILQHFYKNTIITEN